MVGKKQYDFLRLVLYLLKLNFGSILFSLSTLFLWLIIVIFFPIYLMIVHQFLTLLHSVIQKVTFLIKK